MSSNGGTYSIEIQIKGAVQAQQQIKSIGDSMSDMDSTFKSSKSGIDSAGQSIEQFTSGISQAKQPMDQLGSSIDQLGQSSQQLGSSINPLSGEFTALSNNLSRVDSSLKTSNASLQQAGQSFTQLGQQVQTSNAPLAQFGQGMLAAGQSTQQFVGVLSSVGSSLGAISGDITSAGTSLATLNRDLESSADALRTFSSTASSMESDMSSLVGSSSALGHAFSDAAREATNASGGLNEYNTMLGQTEQETEKVKASNQTLGQSFTSQVGSITAVIGSGTSLFLMYNNLSQAQNRVEAASVRLESMQLREQRALIGLNKAVAEHGQFSQQAALAQQNYEVAQGRVAVASERLNQAQIQQNVTFANFAQQVIPTVVTAVGSVVSVFSNLTREGASGVSILDRLRGAFGGAGDEAAQMGETAGEVGNNLATMASGAAEAGTVMTRLGLAIKGTAISVGELTKAFLTNPFTLLATAAAAVIGTIAAFTYNIAGARDAINGLGKAIGDAVPFLRPLLDWLTQVGLGFRQMAGTLSQGGTLIRDEFGNIQLAATDSMTAATIEVDEFGNTVATTLPANVNSGVNEVIAAFERMTMTLTSTFRPAVQDTLTFFQQTFGQTIQVVKESSDLIGELGLTTGQSVEYMNTAVQGASKNFGELGNVFQVVKKDADTFEITTGTLRAVMAATGMTAQEIISIFNSMGLELVEITDVQNGVIAGNKIIAVEFAKVSEVAAAVEERIAAMKEQYGQLSPEVENAARALLTQQLTMDALGQSTSNWTAEQQKAYDMLSTGIDVTADLNTRYEQFKATMDSTVPSLSDLANGFNQQSESMRLMGAVFDVVSQQVNKSTESLRLQNTVLQNIAPSAIATADSIIALVDGQSQIITPAEVVNSILRQQSSELNNAAGFMEFYRNGVQQSGVSLITFIDAMSDAGLISEEVKNQLIEQGKALGLITEEEIKATEATKEHVTVTQQLAQANKELATSLAETVSGIKEGTLLQEAFNKGWMETDKAFQDSIVSLASAQASITRYNQLLAEGKIQSIAFAEGQHEMIQSFQEMDESMANIEGQITAFDALLKGGDVSLKAFNLGLREGQLDARNWYTELKNADGAAIGMDRGLVDLAARLGIDLPQGMSLSTEGLQQFIGVMSGSTTAVQEFKNSIIETAAGITDSLVVGLKSLNKDVDKAVDELADNWKETLGTKMPKATQEALEQIGKDKSWASAAQYGVDQMKTVIDDPEGFADAFESVKKGLLKKMDELSPEAAAAAQKVIAAIEAVANDPHNAALWLNVETAIDNLNQKANELDLTAPFEKGREAAVKYSAEIDAIVSKITSLQPQLKGYESDLAGLALNAPGTIAPLTEPTAAPVAAPTVDTTAATQALQQLQVLAATTVQRIILEFQKVGPAVTQAFNTAVQNAAGTLNQLVAYATQQMTAVGLTAQSVAVAWTTAFNQAVQNAAGTMNQLVSYATQQMTAVGQAAQTVAVAWTQSFNQGAQNAAGSINQLVSHVQSQMATIASSFTQVAVAMTQQFEQGAQNAAGSINTLTSHIASKSSEMVSHLEKVAAAMLKIGSSADSAKSSVDALASAINSLQDKTVTITVQYRTVGSPGGAVAGGLGYHNGNLYMAGGSGISGAGFSPVVIDHPTKLLVGENGPELVSVTPLSNNNGMGTTGVKSPFANMSFEKGTGDISNVGQGTVIQTDSVTFEQNQGPIQINGGGSLGQGTAGLPTTSGGFNNTNVGLGTGQGGTFNVPGGQVSLSGNSVACINGQCYGNPSGFGSPITNADGTLGGTTQQPFEPIRDENGMIKAMETLVEWMKYLGLPTGASVPGTGNFTPGTGTITKGAFASAGQGGAFAGQISMQGGQIVFDSNQGKMQIDTTTGAISIAGQGGAFAQAGNARAGVGIFGTQDQTTEQLTQLNRTMQNVSGSLQAVGNSMASLGNEVVFGNQQAQQTFQGINNNLQGLQTTTQQGLQNVVNGVNLFGAGNQVGFQGFTLPNGQQGGAVGAGGAAGDPLGFLGSMLGGFGINNPFQGATPTGGTGTSPTTGGGTIGTGGSGCNVCGAASGLQGAASDLTGAAGQLGNAVGQLPTGGSNGYGTPTTGGGTLGGGTGGTGNMGGTQPGTGSGCACKCMPMDSDPNRYKIEDGSGNDCNNHIYFNTIEQCHSRLNEICPGENTTPTPTPTNPTPTPGTGMPTTPTMPTFPPGISVSGPGAIACVNGQCYGSNGLIGGAGQIGGQVPGQTGLHIGNPPEPPKIVQQVGLPSQAPDVNQDPASWRIVESAGAAGTFDIIDDSGDVVQLGFRTVTAAQEYLNYFISYYK